jgi:MarR-like DNA-binding transcriptional regulator SgrR of sgrS sRNA
MSKEKYATVTLSVDTVKNLHTVAEQMASDVDQFQTDLRAFFMALKRTESDSEDLWLNRKIRTLRTDLSYILVQALMIEGDTENLAECVKLTNEEQEEG